MAGFRIAMIWLHASIVLILIVACGAEPEIARGLGEATETRVPTQAMTGSEPARVWASATHVITAVRDADEGPTLEEARQQARELESRLLPAIHEAAMGAGEGIRVAVPARRLSDGEIRKAWEIARAPAGEQERLRARLFPGGSEPWRVGMQLHAEGVYISERSARATYELYRKAYKRNQSDFGHGCGPQEALDPEGALSCGFGVKPDGRHSGLSFTIRPEYVTSKNRPLIEYGSDPRGQRDRLVTVVRISGSAPTRSELIDMAASEAFLEAVAVRSVRAGVGPTSWRPELSKYAVWSEIELVVPRDAKSPQLAGSISADLVGPGCRRWLIDVDNLPGDRWGQFEPGKPEVVRLVQELGVEVANPEDEAALCRFGAGQLELTVQLEIGGVMRFVTLPIDLETPGEG